jgi:hypothetical protein
MTAVGAATENSATFFAILRDQVHGILISLLTFHSATMYNSVCRADAASAASVLWRGFPDAPSSRRARRLGAPLHPQRIAIIKWKQKLPSSVIYVYNNSSYRM